MSEGLANIEQDFITLCEGRGLTLLGANSSVSQLMREVQRSREADEALPHAMAIRASLATDAAEKVARAQTLLESLSETLAVLQQEQLKNL